MGPNHFKPIPVVLLCVDRHTGVNDRGIVAAWCFEFLISNQVLLQLQDSHEALGLCNKAAHLHTALHSATNSLL